MIRILLLILILTLAKCPFKGWWPSGATPTGCNQDVSAVYKNNCGEPLWAYFQEAVPGSTIDCSTLLDKGIVAANGSVTFIIHKGKIGRFVFAVSEEGRCSGNAQKVAGWINCDAATNGQAQFNICP